LFLGEKARYIMKLITPDYAIRCKRV